MSIQTVQNETITNGVNVTRLQETIQAVSEQPDLAKFKFRAKNTWKNGSQNEVDLDGFYGTCQEHKHEKPFRFQADEPPVLLGKGEGANPVEYLLTALSSCMTTSLAYHAAAAGINLEKVESEYEGDIDLRGFLDLDPAVRKGYQEIRINFKVKSDADKEKLQKLVEHSPVFDVVTNPTPVKVSFITE
ncbi:OsmC family protein [Nitrospina gracilis]|uniref:OsmC family protein n=1 Tax=Nitrospina gracilis TaxID=35801 RepID=UPI001F44381F|nr:OsmC family protein [Nitrospina gracilis]MCF8719881.1 putative OsmC-like protein [Nitrospina gracilis Nb-211]